MGAAKNFGWAINVGGYLLQHLTGAQRRKITKFNLMRERGLEPPPLSGPDPKSGVSAISPLAPRKMNRGNLSGSTLYFTKAVKIRKPPVGYGKSTTR
jgi:hypothetical protein